MMAEFDAHYTMNVTYYILLAPPIAVPLMLIVYEPTGTFVLKIVS